jgi:PTH1 family peptidyl-tRNA hydrolase
VAIKLVVGLGNPGPKYRGTRHNIGFAVVDELARRAGVAFEVGPVDALVARIRPQGGGDPVLLAKPLTFMNLSGEAVGALMRYYKVAPIDLLVIVDEAQLPLARLRARARGSSGGHNGLRSVAQHLGDDYARLRVGVGRGDARRDLADHVLARFDAAEEPAVGEAIGRAADAAELFVAEGIHPVMNRFNRKEDRTEDTE